MPREIRVFTALGHGPRDMSAGPPMEASPDAALACGWLLSAGRRAAVTIGPARAAAGAGIAAAGFMVPLAGRDDDAEDALLRAASAQARRLAAALPGDGTVELVREPPEDGFDLLLIDRPRGGAPLAAHPACAGCRPRGILVAPRERPERLGRDLVLLADGAPRDLPLMELAARLWPGVDSIRLILAGRPDAQRTDGWRRALAGFWRLSVTAVPRDRAAVIGAILSGPCDLLVAERPARPWHGPWFARQIPALLEQVPAALLLR